jgi:DNA-binding NarL/FixJ family response regulator
MTEHLTPRELEALRLRAQGLSAQEVGVRMGVSVQTVKNFAHAAMQKVGATNTIETLYRLGWIAIPDIGAPVKRAVSRGSDIAEGNQ